MSQINWQENIAQLPSNAIEAIVGTSFVIPLLQSLGYSDNNQNQEFPTGNGNDKVDFAARKDSNNFRENPQNPDFLVEVKGRRTFGGSIINLASGTSQYRKTVNQLKRYLLAPNCKSVKWGIITNGNHLQLFRKHGKVIHPATPNLEISSQNITNIIQRVKTIIETPQRGLTVTFYNNQGGVGKTTTLVNLAGLLSQVKRRKVLVIDFDSQGDLSRLLGINQARNLSMPLLQNQQPELTLYQCLTNTNAHLRQAVERIPIYIPRQKQTIVTDYLWAVAVKEDEKENLQNINISQIQGQASRLKKLIQSVKNDYDYIFIDAPPSSDFFSKSALFAADVVLIPTEHIHVNSLYNAKYLIKNTLPRIQEEKQEGTPVPLPIFFNDHNPTSPSLRSSHRIIQGLIRQENNGYDPDLVPYFYPRSTKILDPYVFSIKKHLHIPNAAVEKRIASLQYRPIAELYLSMAKEYFLDG